MQTPESSPGITAAAQRFLAPDRSVPVAVYLALVAFLAWGRNALLGFPLDDAWIHRVYARSFALGQGLAYNPGQQEAGSTSPLWAIVTAPAHWLDGLGTDATVLAVKLIGVVLGAVCVVLVGRITHRLTRNGLAAGIAATVFALDPRLAFSALSGMETVLLLALLLGACWALLEERYLLSAVLLGLAPTARPEALVLLPLGLFPLARAWTSGSSVRNRVLAATALALPEIAWVLFTLGATGRPLPNTFYAKSQPFSLAGDALATGVRGLAEGGAMPLLVLLFGACAFGFLCLQNRTRRQGPGLPAFLFLVGAPLVYLIAVVGSRQVVLEGYYWTRWIDPASLLAAAGAAIGVSGLLTAAVLDLKRSRRPGLTDRSAIRLTLGAATLLMLLVSAPTLVNSVDDRRSHLESDSRAIDIMNVEMGKWIAENTPEDAIVAVNDAGATRYFGNRYTIDLIGLNNADITFGGEDRRAAALQSADWLVIFPAWFSPEILVGFEPRFETTIPLREYTIANAPGQTRMVAYERASANGSAP